MRSVVLFFVIVQHFSHGDRDQEPPPGAGRLRVQRSCARRVHSGGHDAMSCDLLPTDSPGPHYQGDVRDVLGDGWDLMIAHPECTYLCRAGQRWLNAPTDTRDGKLKGLPRWAATWDAVQFFLEMRDAPIARIAVENPRPGSHVSADIGKPDQVIQPWQFGHGETKATGLWLKNLPPLVPTDVVDGREQRIWKLPPSADRWKIRSTTYAGIAQAMADQWGSLPALPRPSVNDLPLPAAI